MKLRKSETVRAAEIRHRGGLAQMIFEELPKL